jgi:hypothetical protein
MAVIDTRPTAAIHRHAVEIAARTRETGARMDRMGQGFRTMVWVA